MGRSLCPAGTSTDFSNSHDRYVLYVTLCAFSMQFRRCGPFLGALLRCGAISRTLGELARSRAALLPWRFPRYARAVRLGYSAFRYVESGCEDRLCAPFFVLVLWTNFRSLFWSTSSPLPPSPPAVKSLCKAIHMVLHVCNIRLCTRFANALLSSEAPPSPPPPPLAPPVLPPICYNNRSPAPQLLIVSISLT